MGYCYVLSPLMAFGINVALQICRVRFSANKRLLQAVSFGFWGGLLLLAASNGLFLFLLDEGAAEKAGSFLVNLLIYFSCSNIYFHFVNMGETARRIRLLRELYDAPEGLLLNDILLRYNAREIVARRLDRLLGSGQIKYGDSKYYVNKKTMLSLAKIMLLLRMVLLGKTSESVIRESFSGEGVNMMKGGFAQPSLSVDGKRNEDMNEEKKKSLDFIRQIVADDVAAGKNNGKVVTRFPPEPNGYLHIGHAKSICLNFGIAQEFNGRCHLRFDDTNPTKEEQEYIDSIKEDVRWLGFDWGEHEYYASDYFDQLYEWALVLIRDGKAYVDDSSTDEIRAHRGTLTEPGKNSPYRERSVDENLRLFEKMKAGEFKDGEKVLRAKIDMAAPNLNLRDPVLYRILHAEHPRTGGKWCIYPMYDFAHGQSDSIEGITHSICTLEFENHKPLYNWFIENLGIFHSRQYEFARLNLTYTILSKRKLLELVKSGIVDGWDDPRMPTISGIRRRGYTPEAIRAFCDKVGVAKVDCTNDVALLEYCIREDLNKRALRVMGVLNPLKVVITNYPESLTEEVDAINNPEDESAGTRKVPFSREIYIEREDFMEDAPKKFFRLRPGGEVRLRYAYFIKCESVIKDANGNISELHCSYDPATKGGDAPDGRKVKGTIHWVSAAHAFKADVRLYDRLFLKENPDKADDGKDFKSNLNPRSMEVLTECYLEPSLKNAEPGLPYQFERKGYFCLDKKDSSVEKLVFNRTVTLKDSWEKMADKN
jgi:glutaminyl-tRNA synthetase